MQKCYSLEVTIGLEMREYRTSEDDRVVEVCALVRNGTIAPSRTVTVTLQTRSGSATGEYSIYSLQVDSLF